MNDRHRQIAKARRRLAQKPAGVDGITSLINLEAFREAIARIAQAYEEMAQALTAAIRDAAASIDFSALRAAWEQLGKKD